MSTEMQVRIGRRIATARRAKGLSQRQLALAIGGATRTVQTWEADQRHPRTAALARIAEVTDRPVSWFFEVGDYDAVAA